MSGLEHATGYKFVTVCLILNIYMPVLWGMKFSLENKNCLYKSCFISISDMHMLFVIYNCQNIFHFKNIVYIF